MSRTVVVVAPGARCRRIPARLAAALICANLLLLEVATRGDDLKPAPMPDNPAAVRLLDLYGAQMVADRAGNVRAVAFGPLVSNKALASLAGLPRLESLDLSETNVTDANLAKLAHLPRLKSLLLSDTSVGDAGLVHVAALSNLETLALSSTKITDAGIVHLARLQNLRYLHLCQTALSVKGLAPLAELERLKVLRLEGVEMTPVETFELAMILPAADIQVRGLISELSSTTRTRIVEKLGVAFFDEQGHLAIIRHSNDADEALRWLKYYPNVKELSILYSPLSVAGLKHLASFDRLTTLRLHQNGLTSRQLTPLANLQTLVRLELLEPKVTDRAIAHIAKAPKLRKVYLHRTLVTDEGLEQLKTLRPDVSVYLEAMANALPYQNYPPPDFSKMLPTRAVSPAPLGIIPPLQFNAPLPEREVQRQLPELFNPR